jgi:hypothetical protein
VRRWADNHAWAAVFAARHGGCSRVCLGCLLPLMLGRWASTAWTMAPSGSRGCASRAKTCWTGSPQVGRGLGRGCRLEWASHQGAGRITLDRLRPRKASSHCQGADPVLVLMGWCCSCRRAVDRSGRYSSPMTSATKRFAATLGELTGGRVGLTCASGEAPGAVVDLAGWLGCSCARHDNEVGHCITTCDGSCNES